MSAPELSVRGLSVRAGGSALLDGVDLSLPAGCLLAVMGPMGSGKSTLIRALCGRGEGLETAAREALYRGRPLGPGNRPVLVAQRVRESAAAPAESRRLMEARLAEIEAAAASGDVLCIDEPGAGLLPAERRVLMARLSALTAQAAVMVITHLRDDAASFADRVVLLGAGRVVADMPADAFFHAPEDTPAGRFLRTGGLDMPRAETPSAHLAAEHRAAPRGYDLDPAPAGAGETAWVVPGCLGLREVETGPDGTPGPGCWPPAGHVLLTPGPGGAALMGPHACLGRVAWRGPEARPDRDIAAAFDLVALIEEMLGEGRVVLLNPALDASGTAGVLGVFLVSRGFAPDRATEATAAKLPGLRLGMRVEALFWDADLELAARI